MLDAAGYGAALVAEYRRRDSRDWAYSVLSKAWNDGCRTPHLTEHLVSMIVADGVGTDRRGAPATAHVEAAIDILTEGLQAHEGGKGEKLDRMRRRLVQLQHRTTSATARTSASPRNRRRPAAAALGQPPLS